MPLIQLIGMILLLATAGVTLLAGIHWYRSRAPHWGWVALGAPVVYLALLVIVALGSGREILPPGTPQHFCGLYLDCHLSVTVTEVERTPSAWTVHLRVANGARRVALTPHDLRVRLVHADSTVELPIAEASALAAPIEAGGVREVSVAFAAPADGTTPTLRVTEGIGVDRIIEGFLLGDDDALGRTRVRLGL